MNKYLDNINLAIDEGRIEFVNEHARSCLDDHSHLYERKIEQGIYPAVFGEYNTRGLSTRSLELLYELLKDKKQLRILELGAGSGRAAYDMYKCAQDKNASIHIDTVALTPFAPNYRLLCGYKTMVEQFTHFFDSLNPFRLPQWVKDVLYFYYKMYIWKVDSRISPFSTLNKVDYLILLKEAQRRPWGLPINAAFELDKRGFKFFESCPEYVNKQFIGNLIDNNLIYDNKYDLIHDEWGALHYTLRYEENEFRIKFLIDHLFASMKSDAVLYIANLRENKVDLFDDLNFKQFSAKPIANYPKSVEIIAKK